MLRTSTGYAVGSVLEDPKADLHIPALGDVEVVSTLRRLAKEPHATLSAQRARAAIADLLDLPLTRHTHEYLVERAFALRDNFSAYDAVYIALAELLGAEFLTADRALAKAPLPKDLKITAF